MKDHSSHPRRVVQRKIYGLLTLMMCGIIVMLGIGMDEVVGHQQKTIALQLSHIKRIDQIILSPMGEDYTTT
jgi:hypothetical protein